MSQLQWDVRVARSPEPAAHAIVLATRALDAGDRPPAERGYREVQRQGLVHPVSWSNLAAVAGTRGDAAGARAHAQRALQLDRGNADAWVNFGVASWQLGQRRDAAQAMHHALRLAPAMEAAAMNYARMQQAIGRGAQALDILRAASAVVPGSWQLALARAEQAYAENRLEDAERELALVKYDPDWDAKVEALKQGIAFARASKAGPDEGALRGRQRPRADDHEARLALAGLLAAARRYREALDELLEIVMRDKQWNDQLARRTYVAVLELMSKPAPKAAPEQAKGALEAAGRPAAVASDPVVDQYRRKLSMALF